jgi:hypothetical protein
MVRGLGGGVLVAALSEAFFSRRIDMSLPLNGPIVITLPNAEPANGSYKCVATFRGSASVLAESSDSDRDDALDEVIAALRSHSLGDLTLLPMMITTGGKLEYKYI